MNIEKKLEEIEKQLEKNTNKIIDNANNIDKNKGKIKQNSYALDILKDYKNGSKRLFIILIIVLIMWFATIGYLIYVLNDIGTIEEETTQEISDIQTIENSNIINKGDIDGENKTNN